MSDVHSVLRIGGSGHKQLTVKCFLSILLVVVQKRVNLLLWSDIFVGIITGRNEVVAKVIFLHLSVILFTGGCYPSMHCRWYPSMPCSRSWGDRGLQDHTQGGSLGGSVQGGCLLPGGGGPALGGLLPGGCLLPVGACSQGGWCGLLYGLLLCPSVMAFWFGGLLIEGSLLVWSWRGQKAITEGHHTRRPYQKAITEDHFQPEGHQAKRP